MSTATVGPADNRDIDEEAGTATPTTAGAATLLLVLVPFGMEGRSGAGGIGLKGGIAEALGAGAAFGGVLTTIGLPFNQTKQKTPKFRQ